MSRTEGRVGPAIYKAVQQDFGGLGSTAHETVLNTRLAAVELALGNYRESLSLCRQSLLGAVQLGLERTPDQLLLLGCAAASCGMASDGAKLVSAAMRQYRGDQGFDIPRWGHVQMERFERSCREALGDDGYEMAAREGEALSDDEVRQLALSVTTHD